MPAYRDEEKDSKMQYWMSHKLKEGNDKKKRKKEIVFLYFHSDNRITLISVTRA